MENNTLKFYFRHEEKGFFYHHSIASKIVGHSQVKHGFSNLHWWGAHGLHTR
jgi:hypothetical protein